MTPLVNRQPFAQIFNRHGINMVVIANIVVVMVAILISGLPHAYNMFEYPYYENDEGTYMAQAESLFTTGELAPYTYWYDHAPGGWIQLGLWALLTNGFQTFGFSINSGRVLMLILHVLSSLLLLGIGRKIFKNDIPGLIAIVIFSFSPLGLYFQRRVLLDNIMTFWLLLSLYLALGDKRTLAHYAGSAIALSIAFLSKESVIYLMPAMLLTVVVGVRRCRNKFPLFLWLALIGLLISLYPLYALLKGELFPTGSLLGGTQPHVSLLETLRFQNEREGGFFLSRDSGFMINVRGWAGEFGLYSDPTLIIAGIAATIIVAVIAVRFSKLRPVALLTLSYWTFLARGGVVIEFYIIPHVPLLAFCIGASIYVVVRWLWERVRQPVLRPVFAALLVGVVASPFVVDYRNRTAIYTSNQTENQVEAVNFIRENVPTDSFVLIDMYAYTELQEDFKRAHYYWKADRDPEITDDVLANDWCNIDYILATPQLTYDAVRAGLELTRIAYENSEVLRSYSGAGWDIEVRKVDKTACSSTRIASSDAPPAS